MVGIIYGIDKHKQTNDMKKNFIDDLSRENIYQSPYDMYSPNGMYQSPYELGIYDSPPAPIEPEPVYNPKIFAPQDFYDLPPAPIEPEMPVYQQPIYEQPAYGNPKFLYPVDEQPVYEQPVYQPRYEPVDMPVYNPRGLQFPVDYEQPRLEPVDADMPVLNPPALPIYEPQPKLSLYIPKFPDFSKMSCDDLQSEINDMNQIMMTSRMVQEVRMAYETALSDAQNAYIQNCSKNRIEPVCYDPPLAQMEGYRWIVSGQDENGCNIWEMVEDKDTSTSGGGVVTSGGGGVTGGGVVTSGGGVFVDDKKTPVKTVQSGDKADGTFKDDTKALPTKAVSKNLQPYIYAGLGIVVILLVSRMLTKKN